MVRLNTKTYAVDVLSDIKKVEKIIKKNAKKNLTHFFNILNDEQKKSFFILLFLMISSSFLEIISTVVFVRIL